jgi:hypothetical protein
LLACERQRPRPPEPLAEEQLNAREVKWPPLDLGYVKRLLKKVGERRVWRHDGTGCCGEQSEPGRKRSDAGRIQLLGMCASFGGVVAAVRRLYEVQGDPQCVRDVDGELPRRADGGYGVIGVAERTVSEGDEGPQVLGEDLGDAGPSDVCPVGQLVGGCQAPDRFPRAAATNVAT